MRVCVSRIYASTTATNSDTDLKLRVVAEADKRCTSSNAFKTRFVAVGDHTSDA